MLVLAPSALNSTLPARHKSTHQEAASPNRKKKKVTFARHAGQRLKDASMALGLARLQLQTGHTQIAETILELVHEQVQSLRRQLEGKTGKTPLGPSRMDSHLA